MIAYFFHFCQSDFRDLWGHGEVGLVGGGEVGGEAADFGDFPHLRCLFALLPRRGGSEFQPLPPFTLP